MGLSRTTSRSTVLLHLGHLGYSSASITYIKQRGHPASIIDVVSGLLEYRSSTFSSSWTISSDTQEFVGDIVIGDDRLGDSWWVIGQRVFGGDKLSFRSSLICPSSVSVLLLMFSTWRCTKTRFLMSSKDESQLAPWKVKNMNYVRKVRHVYSSLNIWSRFCMIMKTHDCKISTYLKVDGFLSKARERWTCRGRSRNWK